jgi:predicted phage-related endonuclease
MYAWGHRLEPLVAEAYTERTGRPLRRAMQLLRHPNVPWALASLDRVSARKGERRLVELKVSDLDAKYAGDDLPGDVQAQVQHQLWVTGYEVADVAVLRRHWRLGVFEVARDDEYLDNLIYLERWLWDLVERREMPPVDGTESSRRVLAQLYRQNNGLMLPATADLDLLAEELRIAKAEAKAAGDREATVENAVRAVIGDADGFEGSWGRITWKRNRDSERTDWKEVAAAYDRIIDRVHEWLVGNPEATEADVREMVTFWSSGAAQALYTRTVEGPRVLRPYFKEEGI